MTRDEVLRVADEILANLTGALLDGACACHDTKHDLEQLVKNAQGAEPLASTLPNEG